MNAPDLPAGTLVGGDFRIVETLARGGMGVVYVAEQESTRKRRALKVMLPQPGDLDALRKRFEQEAYVASQIESDHVVEVIGAGVDAATTMPWIAMEMLEGEDLENHLTNVGPLDWTDTWNLVGELCHALEAAHKLGLIHRDLKPSNVYLAKSRRPGVERVVKILDFGIAKRMTDAGKTTGALGTPLYMAPEQTATGSSFSPATDVWALGLLVFETMVGVPFWRAASQDGAIAALLREVVLEPIPPASERAALFGKGERLPPRFDAWFARCVVRDPKARFQDAGEAYRALARVFAEVTGLNERVIPPSSRMSRAPDLGTEPPVSLPREALPARTHAVLERSTAPVPARSRTGVLVAGIAAGVAVVSVALAVVFVVGVSGPAKATGSTAPGRDPAPEPPPVASAAASAARSEPEVLPSTPASAEVVPSAAAATPPVVATGSGRSGPRTAPVEPKTAEPATPPAAPPRPPPPKPPPASPDPVIL